MQIPPILASAAKSAVDEPSYGFYRERFGSLIAAALRDEKSINISAESSNSDTEVRLGSLKRLTIGKSVYPFRRRVDIGFCQNLKWLFAFPLASVDIHGKGDAFDVALADLSEKFHRRFQFLLVKSIFEMTREEQTEWNLFSQWVDVAKHKTFTPLEMRRIGTVHSVEPFQVQWLGEEEPSPIDLRKAPGLLASYRIGTDFESMVEFHRGKQEVTRILCVGPVRGFSATESAAFEDNTLIDDTAEHGWNSF